MEMKRISIVEEVTAILVVLVLSVMCRQIALVVCVM